MSARGAACLELFRSTLAATDTLDLSERDRIYSMLVADLRSRRSECVSPLTLGPPTDPMAIRDPRRAL